MARATIPALAYHAYEALTDRVLRAAGLRDVGEDEVFDNASTGLVIAREWWTKRYPQAWPEPKPKPRPRTPAWRRREQRRHWEAERSRERSRSRSLDRMSAREILIDTRISAINRWSRTRHPFNR